MRGLWVRVLGPVQVTVEGTPAPVDRAQRRAVLAFLALHHDRAVPAEWIIDALWGDAPPATARTQIHAAVSTLRRIVRVAEGTPIRGTTAGYHLDVGPDDLDYARFTTQVRSARAAGDPATAAGLLHTALDLWQGEPLAGISGAFVEAARARLWEEYHAARDLLVRAELELGHHHELVADLTAQVEAHPLREGSVAHLMLALYRCGRSADALATYRTTRDNLVRDLGVEPGPACATCTGRSWPTTPRCGPRSVRTSRGCCPPTWPTSPVGGPSWTGSTGSRPERGRPR